MYDTRDQLIGATSAATPGLGTPAFIPADEDYGYDGTGNRLGDQGQSQSTSGSHNRLQTDGTYNYEYDNEGNTAQRTNIATGEIREYTWDHRNRLTKVVDKQSVSGPVIQEVRYDYDAFDRLVIKQVFDGSSQLTRRESRLWDHDHVLMQLVDVDGSGSELPRVTNRFLHGPMIDMLLADEQNVNNTDYTPLDSGANGSAGVTLWALTDHLGSVRDLYDNNDKVRKHILYDSFGNRVLEQSFNASGTQINNHDAAAMDAFFGFTAREWDADIGMQYNRARWYDPLIGRWFSQDPIGFGGGDANLYRYVENRATRLTDPSGLQDRVSIGVIEHSEEELEKMGIPKSTIEYFKERGYTFNPTLTELNRIVGLPKSYVVDGFMVSVGEVSVYGTRYTDENGNCWYETNVFATDKNGLPVHIGHQYWDDFNQMLQAHHLQHVLRLTGGLIGTTVGIWALSTPSPHRVPTRPGMKISGAPLLLSFDDIILNPLQLYGKSAGEVAKILGPGWTLGQYGRTGTGWAFRNGDKIVFFHEGGRHVGTYCGVRSGLYNFKVVGPGYKPLPGDKALIIPFRIPKPTGTLK